MTNIIGLTESSKDRTIMVNADNIVFFRSTTDLDNQIVSEIQMVGGAYLLVREDIFDIVERIDADRMADLQ